MFKNKFKNRMLFSKEIFFFQKKSCTTNRATLIEERVTMNWDG